MVDQVGAFKRVQLKMRQAVFISGKGSNLKALLDAQANTGFYVFSNKACEGLVWAKRRGFFSEVVSLKSQEDWESFSRKINDLQIKRIFLLGFMKVIPELFLDVVKARVVNIHPTALPKFPGLNSMERSFEAKDGRGCTFHEVNAEVDGGEVILKKSLDTELPVTLQFLDFKERIHGFEQQLVAKHIEMSRGAYE